MGAMYKKLLYCFVGVSFLIGALLLPQGLAAEGYCAFCDAEVLERQKFYEDELVIALYTHKPVFPGHCLVIPKRHIERFEMVTDEEMVQMTRVIKRVNIAASKVFNTVSYLLLQKNGPEVGQSVPHVHFHYISREKGDDSALKFLARMYIINLQKPLPAIEMEEIVAEMREAMSSLENP